MKKIVSILAVAAMAASMFAVDVAATAKLKSDLFSYNADTGAMTVLGALADDADPDLTFAVSGDKAGAGFKIKHGQADVPFAMNVWFKPTDSIKLSFNENGDNLFADHYNWWNAYSMAAIPAGYGIEYSSNGLTIKVNAAADAVTKTSKDADVAIGDVGTMVVYGADFGKVAVVADFKTNFKKITLGAGYTNTFNGVEVIADADVVLNDGLQEVKFLGFVGGSAGDIAYAAVTNVKYTEAHTAVALKAKASYNIDAVKATLKFESADLLADTFDALIGVDFDGSVGAASWSVQPNYAIASKTFKVGFVTSLSF